jgi:hypothetical protein
VRLRRITSAARSPGEPLEGGLTADEAAPETWLAAASVLILLVTVAVIVVVTVAALVLMSVALIAIVLAIVIIGKP